MKKTIEACNAWLKENNITDLVFKPKKDMYFGTVIGLYAKGWKRDTCILHSPALGELTEAVCREYNLDLDKRPTLC